MITRSKYQPHPAVKWLARRLMSRQWYTEWLWGYARRDRRPR